MLIIQAPGAILVIYFQAILNKEDFTTWSPYVVTLIEQVILIVQCLYYKRLNKQEKDRTRLLDDLSKEKTFIE